MWKCKNCGDENSSDFDVCSKCGARNPESLPLNVARKPKAQASDSQPTFISLLRLCGNIDLVVGLLGALFMLSSKPSSPPYPTGESNNLYLVFALLIAFQGFAVFVLFNVFAGMAENLIVIRNELSNGGKKARDI